MMPKMLPRTMALSENSGGDSLAGTKGLKDSPLSVGSGSAMAEDAITTSGHRRQNFARFREASARNAVWHGGCAGPLHVTKTAFEGQEAAGRQNRGRRHRHRR